MSRNSINEIKRARKKSLFLRKISELVQSLSAEDAAVAAAFITRVELSSDTGICYIYFSSFPDPSGLSSQEVFDKALEKLKLYKPSMRKALSKMLHGRYVPDLIFLFDEKREKVGRINELLSKVHEEVEGYDESEE